MGPDQRHNLISSTSEMVRNAKYFPPGNSHAAEVSEQRVLVSAGRRLLWLQSWTEKHTPCHIPGSLSQSYSMAMGKWQHTERAVLHMGEVDVLRAWGS